MDLGVFGHGYLLIGCLIVVGAGLLVLALTLNHRLAASVRNEDRHQEKRLEYQRNTVSQLGMLLVGIGVSLFIFYFQQDFQNQRKREGEIEQVLAKLASRVGRAAADLEFLPEYDEILDRGGPYVDPDYGGANPAVTASGADLAKLVDELRLIERDVGLNIFGDLGFSSDLQGSPLMTEFDPAVWLSMHRDENELRYAVAQLAADYQDLSDVIGGAEPLAAVADPVKGPKVKQEVLDVLYDLDLLRDRSRRVVARACWFVSQGRDFVSLHPMDEVRRRYRSHAEWIEQARIHISPYSVGGINCFDMLSYEAPAAAPPTPQ